MEQADFILAHGTEAVGTAGECTHGAAEPRTLEQLSGLLAAAAARTSRPPPPMVVANPDLVTVDGASLITMWVQAQFFKLIMLCLLLSCVW